MIAIVNVSGDDAPITGPNKYELRINNTVMCEFMHDRKANGLSQCLRDAADAFDKADNAKLDKLLITMIGMIEDEKQNT